MTKFSKKLSIIIPVYNEKKTIEKVLDKITKITDVKKEIIVVDDFSDDGSYEILKINKKKITKLIHHSRNLGKGAAIKSAKKFITGDIVIIQDADLEYNPNDYPLLLNPFFDDDADVVYGSRLAATAPHRVLYYWHYVMNKFLTTLSNSF